MANFTIPGIDGRPMPVSEKQYTDHWNRVFRSDPEMVSIHKRVSGMGGGEEHKERAAAQRAIALGWRPPDQDWSLDFDKGGFRTERANAWTRNQDWLIPLIIGAGTMGIGAAGIGPAAGLMGAGGGGGAAATGGAAAAGAAPSMAGIPIGTATGIGLGTPVTMGAGLGGAAAGTAGAAAGGGGFLSSVGGTSGLLGTIGKYAPVAGAALAGRAEGRAEEADYLLDRDREATARALVQNRNQFDSADLDLRRRTTGAELDRNNFNNSLRLGLLGSNPTIDVPEHIKGRTATFSDVGPEGVQGRDEIISRFRPRIMDALEKGQQFEPLTLEDMPGLSTPPQPGGVDRALGAIGTAGTIGGILGDLFGRKQTPTVAPPTPGLTPRQVRPTFDPSLYR